MGSYISILNDTPEDWMCKLSYHAVALKVGILVASIVGVVAAVIATGGAASPLMTVAASAGVTAVYGVPTASMGAIGSTLTTITGGIAMIGGVSTFSYSIANGIAEELSIDNFFLIKAGTKHSWMRTLSLWQQGTCVQTTILNEYTVRTRTLYMSPIFSGATVNSNVDHSIAWWLNQRGAKEDFVQATNKIEVPADAQVLGNSSAEVKSPAPFLQPVTNTQ